MLVEICSCLNCGTELTKTQRYNRQKYCSRKCANDARYGKQFRFGKIKTRSAAFARAAELCRSGMTQAEAAKQLGIHPQTISDWFSKYGAEKIFPDRVCAYCGKSLAGMPLLSARKYCSKNCGSNARYAAKHAQRRHRAKPDLELRCAALALYWDGLNPSAIARHFGISEWTVYSWIRRFGGGRERRQIPEVKIRAARKLTSFQSRMRAAKTSDEWASILRTAIGNHENSDITPICLVCEPTNGHGGVSRYAAIVLDILKMDPSGCETFAFCGKCHDIITTIQWRQGAYRLAEFHKPRGSYLWPRKELGTAVILTASEFEFLLSYQKTLEYSYNKC